MQAAPARYVSVSELYSTDEVELLLDEIRELEPTSCRGEDVQDFEIAGSGCGGGGRSPAGTEATERSWDSHAQYRREPPPRPAPLAPLYCHLRYLVSLEGLFSLLIVVCSSATCALVWTAAGGRPGGAARPLALAALSSALLHAALLTPRVTRLHRLLPLDWRALGLCAGAWTLAASAAGASVLLAAALAAPPAPRRDLYLAAVGLGYCGALCGGVLAGAAARRVARRAARRGARGAYRAVPAAELSAPHSMHAAPL